MDGAVENLPASMAVANATTHKVCKYIVDSGGFDGIVGFSQGFDVAAAVAERVDWLHERVSRKLTFIAGFGVSHELYLARDKFGEPEPYVPRGPKGVVKLFLCTGDADELCGTRRIERLRAIFTESGAAAAVETHAWSGGHAMPPQGDAAYKKLLEFIDPIKR
jgi:predicted esterase